MKTNVKIKMLRQGAIMPIKEFEDSAGYDLFTPEEHYVPLGGSSIPLGFAVQLEHGVGMFPFSRSGIAIKGIEACKSKESYLTGDKPRRYKCKVNLGLIDSDYRGECGVLIWNDDEPFYIPQTSPIGQAVFAPVYDAEFELVDRLNLSARGAQGFYS